MPCVRVWEVGGAQVAEVQSHKYGVSCVAFSTNSCYIVSVGYQHDMTVSVWDWRVSPRKHTFKEKQFSNNLTLEWFLVWPSFTSCCVSRKVPSSPPTKCPAECLLSPSLRTAAILSQRGTDTSSSGTWTPLKNDGYHSDLSQSQLFLLSSQLSGFGFSDLYIFSLKSLQVNSAVPLIGRSGLLGDHKNSVFSGVACGRGLMAFSTYCITSSGLLCLFNSSRHLEAWVNLKVRESTPTYTCSYRYGLIHLCNVTTITKHSV